MIIFRPPTDADIEHVAANMRAVDVLECRLFGDRAPLEALRQSVADSEWSFTAEVDDDPVAIFGLGDSEGLLSGKGAPWLLGVNGMARHGRKLLTFSAPYIERMRAEYEELENMVLASNHAAIRFLQWSGFEMSAPFMFKGIAARRFSRSRPQHMAA